MFISLDHCRCRHMFSKIFAIWTLSFYKLGPGNAAFCTSLVGTKPPGPPRKHPWLHMNIIIFFTIQIACQFWNIEICREKICQRTSYTRQIFQKMYVVYCTGTTHYPRHDVTTKLRNGSTDISGRCRTIYPQNDIIVQASGYHNNWRRGKISQLG